MTLDEIQERIANRQHVDIDVLAKHGLAIPYYDNPLENSKVASKIIDNTVKRDGWTLNSMMGPGVHVMAAKHPIYGGFLLSVRKVDFIGAEQYIWMYMKILMDKQRKGKL